MQRPHQLQLIKFDSPCYWRDRYLADKRFKLAPKTLVNYRRTINLFIEAAPPKGWPPAYPTVLDFLAAVEARASRVTACSYWSTLRAWFNYLDKVGAFGEAPNPADQIVKLGLAPSRPKLAPKGVPAGLMAVLLGQLRASSDFDLSSLRDLALIHFLWRTGARSGEAASLSRSLLDLEIRRVFIPAELTKTDEDRTLYFGRKVAADLGAWLEALEATGYEVDWIFPSFANQGHRPRAQPLTISGVYRMFQRRLRQAGLPRYRVHDLRHGFTKAAMRAGISLASIQAQLGHTTPEMVLRYAKAFSVEQEREFRDFGD